MSKIDLSKAKIGDKFINKEGTVLELIKVHSGYEYPYELKDEIGHSYSVTNDGSYVKGEDGSLDLVRVFDELLSAMEKIERSERINRDMQKIAEIADEEKQELQRRQYVVELAEKLVTNELFAVTNHIHDMRELGAAINLDSPTEYAFLIAEEFVNTRGKYLKKGKL